MRAKTILAMLFLVSLGVAAMVVLRSLPQKSEAAAEVAGREEILVATMPLAAGTLLRAPDVTWQAIGRPAERGEIVRPLAGAREAQPKADEEARAEVYGAALRKAVSPGDSTNCKKSRSPGLTIPPRRIASPAVIGSRRIGSPGETALWSAAP